MNALYLAAPIDAATPAQKLRIREGIESIAVWAGGQPEFNCIFNPAEAWTLAGGEVTRHLQQVNLAALDACAAVVAYLPQGVPTIGVVTEIAHARETEKPVLVVVDEPSRSWALAHILERDGYPAHRSIATIDQLQRDEVVMRRMPFTGKLKFQKTPIENKDTTND